VTNFQHVLEAAMRLTPEDRGHLIDRLVDTLSEPIEPPALTDAMKRELDRRIADMEANPDDEIPWEVVDAELAEELGRCRPK
jgi:putative addiction module component (TIGR02574 family)